MASDAPVWLGGDELSWCNSQSRVCGFCRLTDLVPNRPRISYFYHRSFSRLQQHRGSIVRNMGDRGIAQRKAFWARMWRRVALICVRGGFAIFYITWYLLKFRIKKKKLTGSRFFWNYVKLHHQWLPCCLSLDLDMTYAYSRLIWTGCRPGK